MQSQSTTESTKIYNEVMIQILKLRLKYLTLTNQIKQDKENAKF
jgi:hypothetical protein